jgi:hypothetical protein
MKNEVADTFAAARALEASAGAVTITGGMIDAGAAALWELAGEASKEAQARAVFSAMLTACRDETMAAAINTAIRARAAAASIAAAEAAAVEIGEAMVDAGADVILGELGGADLGGHFSAADLARRVYAGMAEVATGPAGAAA